MGQTSSALPKLSFGGGGGAEAQAFVVSRYHNGLQGSLMPIVLPPPGPTEAVVSVVAASLNVADARRLRGAATMGGLMSDNDAPQHGMLPLPLPYIAGVDGAGIIESVGDADVARRYNIHVGDRVQFHLDPCRSNGALAEKTVVNLNCCFRLLDSVSFHEAASMPTCSWAAYIALFDKLRIQPGMTVFVHGGSGGVGHIAVQLARYHGCRVFASCSPPNVAFVESLGADNVFDYTRSDVRQLLDAATGGVGVDCILDTVGDVARFVDVLRFGGSVCCLKPAALPHPAHLSSRQASIHFLHLDGLFSSDSLTGVFRQVGEETLKLHQAGAFSVCMEVLRTDQIRQGMTQVATGHTRGKFVVDLSKPAP